MFRSVTVSLESILILFIAYPLFFFFSSRRRHTRLQGDWSSDVCSSDLASVALHWPWVTTGYVESHFGHGSSCSRRSHGDSAGHAYGVACSAHVLAGHV